MGVLSLSPLNLHFPPPSSQPLQVEGGSGVFACFLLSPSIVGGEEEGGGGAPTLTAHCYFPTIVYTPPTQGPTLQVVLPTLCLPRPCGQEEEGLEGDLCPLPWRAPTPVVWLPMGRPVQEEGLPLPAPPAMFPYLEEKFQEGPATPTPSLHYSDGNLPVATLLPYVWCTTSSPLPAQVPHRCPCCPVCTAITCHWTMCPPHFYYLYHPARGSQFPYYLPWCVDITTHLPLPDPMPMYVVLPYLTVAIPCLTTPLFVCCSVLRYLPCGCVSRHLVTLPPTFTLPRGLLPLPPLPLPYPFLHYTGSYCNVAFRCILAYVPATLTMGYHCMPPPNLLY